MNEEDNVDVKRIDEYQTEEWYQSSMSGSSSSGHNYLRRRNEYRTVHSSIADKNQHSIKADPWGSNQTTPSTNHQGVDKSKSNIVAVIQTSKLWVPVTRDEYRDLIRMPITLSQKQAQEASKLIIMCLNGGSHLSLRHHNQYPTRDGKQSTTRRALFTDQLNIYSTVDQ